MLSKILGAIISFFANVFQKTLVTDEEAAEIASEKLFDTGNVGLTIMCRSIRPNGYSLKKFFGFWPAIKVDLIAVQQGKEFVFSRLYVAAVK